MQNTYRIFARKNYDEPLMEVGEIKADSIEQAREAALEKFPADDWLEMIAIPNAAFISVLVKA